MTICLLTEVKWQSAMLVLGWLTVWVLDRLWDVFELEFLCRQTFINSSALLMSLMVCARAMGPKHLLA